MSGSTRRSDNTGTHIGSLWTSTGTSAGDRARSAASPRQGWQELDFSSPVAVTAGHHLCGLLPHQHRALRGHHQRAGVGGDQRAADRAGQRRRLRLRLRERLPVEQLQRIELLGRRGVLAIGGQHAAGGDDRHAERGSTGNPVSVAPTATFSQAVVPSTVSFTLKDSGGNSGAGLGERSTAPTRSPRSRRRARWRRAPPTPPRCRGRRTPPARR